MYLCLLMRPSQPRGRMISSWTYITRSSFGAGGLISNLSQIFCLILSPASTSTIYLSSKHFFLPSLHTVEANIDVVPKKTRSPHPWRRQPATAREDTAVPGPTWTPPPSSVEWVNIFLNACQIFLQTTHL